MKNKLVRILLLMLVVGMFTFVIGEVAGGDRRKKEDSEADEQIGTETEDGEKSSCSYADVEDLVLYLAGSEEQKNELSRLIDPLTKSDNITVAYIKKVVDIIEVSTDVYTGVLNSRSDSSKVYMEEFEKIYNYIVCSGEISGLSRDSVYVFCREELSSDDGTATKAIFDGNRYYRYDVDIDEGYDDRVIDAYIRDGVIFKILGYSDAEVEINNVWVISSDKKECTFLYNGITKTYMLQNGGEDADNITDGAVAKITVNNFGVCSVKKCENVIDARIISASDSGFRVKDRGRVDCAPNFTIYDVCDTPMCENSKYILTGYKNVELVLENKKAVAAVIREELASDNIRVILNDDTFSTYTMNTATLSCNKAFNVKYPDGQEVYNAEGTAVTIDHSNYNVGDKIYFTPAEKHARFTVHSIKRSYGNPEYRGTMEIVIVEEGLRIINELPLEEYLYSVVANEMPAGSPKESLKAIAVCARGYAYIKMNDNSFDGYDAHLDDSSMCQVYNNVRETEEAIEAVKETYGIVPMYNGKVILPLYFSTSAGMTCSNADIWGGNAYGYLEANLEDVDKTKIDFSDEDTFVDFMKDDSGYDIIEKDLPYYRWDIDFTNQDMTNAIKSTLSERISMSYDNIKVKNDSGEFVNAEINYIGEVKSISVVERSSSGVLLTLEIEGSNATIRVSGQTNIRNLITPVNQEIVKNDGQIVTGWTSLPRPLYYSWWRIWTWSRNEQKWCLRIGRAGL